jgi:hypothetical protein
VATVWGRSIQKWFVEIGMEELDYILMPMILE